MSLHTYYKGEVGLDRESIVIRSQRLKTILFPKISKGKPDFLTTYAVMEAGASLNGATSMLMAALEDYEAPMWSSLLNTNGDSQLAHLAPYLIELEACHTDEDRTHAGLTHFTDWLFNQPDLPGWGYFVRSKKPFDDIFDFFARMAVVQMENGQHAFFRIASPKVFTSYFSHQNNEELSEMVLLLDDIYVFNTENYNILNHVTLQNGSYGIERISITQEDQPEFEGA